MQPTWPLILDFSVVAVVAGALHLPVGDYFAFDDHRRMRHYCMCHQHQILHPILIVSAAMTLMLMAWSTIRAPPHD